MKLFWKINAFIYYQQFELTIRHTYIFFLHLFLNLPLISTKISINLSSCQFETCFLSFSVYWYFSMIFSFFLVPSLRLEFSSTFFFVFLSPASVPFTALHTHLQISLNQINLFKYHMKLLHSEFFPFFLYAYFTISSVRQVVFQVSSGSNVIFVTKIHHWDIYPHSLKSLPICLCALLIFHSSCYLISFPIFVCRSLYFSRFVMGSQEMLFQSSSTTFSKLWCYYYYFLQFVTVFCNLPAFHVFFVLFCLFLSFQQSFSKQSIFLSKCPACYPLPMCRVTVHALSLYFTILRHFY